MTRQNYIKNGNIHTEFGFFFRKSAKNKENAPKKAEKMSFWKL